MIERYICEHHQPLPSGYPGAEPERWRLHATDHESAVEEALSFDLPFRAGWVADIRPATEAEWQAAEERAHP